MNVFVLCTGRCGSVTFAKACSHMTNYTSGHETSQGHLGADRIAMFKGRKNHIEVDPRFCWFLGRLQAEFGNNAFYVHLRRDPELVAQSLLTKFRKMETPSSHGIMFAYRRGILQGTKLPDPYAICKDYIETVTLNIQEFLRDKPHQQDVWLERAEVDFPVFWNRIGAEGDLASALSEWTVKHNVGRPRGSVEEETREIMARWQS